MKFLNTPLRVGFAVLVCLMLSSCEVLKSQANAGKAAIGIGSTALQADEIAVIIADYIEDAPVISNEFFKEGGLIERGLVIANKFKSLQAAPVLSAVAELEQARVIGQEGKALILKHYEDTQKPLDPRLITWFNTAGAALDNADSAVAARDTAVKIKGIYDIMKPYAKLALLL